MNIAIARSVATTSFSSPGGASTRCKNRWSAAHKGASSAEFPAFRARPPEGWLRNLEAAPVQSLVISSCSGAASRRAISSAALRWTTSWRWPTTGRRRSGTCSCCAATATGSRGRGGVAGGQRGHRGSGGLGSGGAHGQAAGPVPPWGAAGVGILRCYWRSLHWLPPGGSAVGTAWGWPLPGNRLTVLKTGVFGNTRRSQSYFKTLVCHGVVEGLLRGEPRRGAGPGGPQIPFPGRGYSPV